MTIQKVSPTKLQVNISNEDIASLKVSRDSLICNSPEAQELISDIMATAKANCEFEPAGENIVVEAVSSETEGIEFNLTVAAPPKVAIAAKEEKKQTMTIFRANTASELSSFCLHLSELYYGESYLFKHKGAYYIALMTALLPKYAGYDFGLFVENSDTFFSYLKENGKILVAGDLFDARIPNRRIA